MKEIADLIMNYGIGVICIVYFMYFTNTTLKNLLSTMNEMKQSLVLLNERIENMEQTISSLIKKKNKKSGE